MNIFSKFCNFFWKRKYSARLKGHKTTKEIAHQLMWALENDIVPYAEDKNIKLKFEVLPSCTIFFGAILPQEINDNIDNYNISPFDTDIVWLDYKDILWVILHYEEEVRTYKERIDKLYNMIKKRSD